MRSTVRLALVASIAAFTVAAWTQLWAQALAPDGLFALDLKAYTTAAWRLVQFGSPYSTEVMSGPVANVIANVPIGYFYPPVLAQLFVPIADVPVRFLGAIWVLAQVGAALVVFPCLVPVGKPRILISLLVMASSYPFHWALIIGNLSGWLAIAVGALLLTGPRSSGAITALVAAIKMTPGPLVAIAVASRTSRRHALIAIGLIVLASAALAPRAWMDWLTALPNILNNDMALTAKNYSPAHVMWDLGIPASGFLESVLAAAFGIWAVRIALRRGTLTTQSIAAAAGSMTFASSTMWDHYLAVLAPLTLFLWFRADRIRRLAIWMITLTFMGIWLKFDYFVAYRAVLAVATVAFFVVAASASEAGPDRTGATTLPVTSG